LIQLFSQDFDIGLIVCERIFAILTAKSSLALKILRAVGLILSIKQKALIY